MTMPIHSNEKASSDIQAITSLSNAVGDIQLSPASGRVIKALHLAVISDIHLGHKRNSTSEIIANLRCAIPDDAKSSELNIIFLAGDVFDDLLNLPDNDVLEISGWISHLLYVCKKHDILLRILEGTPSHDWKQSQLFLMIEKITNSGADVKYITDLSIEYIERFDINVLYVPDEWDNPETTMVQVHQLLRAKGLEKVDYAIMHGQFEYQLPAHVKAPKHDSASYLAIVKELIFIGHVHLHSRYDRIIAQGSFDRLSHGEEGPKGHVRAIIYPDGRKDITFVENVNAKKFVTIKVNDMSLDDSLAVIDDNTMFLPEKSHVRIEANYDHPLFTSMEVLIRRNPLLTWTKLPREQEKDEEVFVEDNSVFVAITITKENLPALLLERVANSGAAANVLNMAELLLGECL
jgi:DNA repair exonuclease SbcCD nuclease subunit